VRERALEQVQRLDRGVGRIGQAGQGEGDQPGPEAVAQQVDAQLGVGLVDAAQQRAQALLADHPGPLLHLEVGELAQRLLGPVPQPPEGVAETGRATLAGLGHGVGEAA
jgi:hypothetical protein